MVESLEFLSSSLGSHSQINLVIQDLEQRDELIDRLAVVRLIQQAVKLSRGSPQPPDDLAL